MYDNMKVIKSFIYWKNKLTKNPESLFNFQGLQIINY